MEENSIFCEDQDIVVENVELLAERSHCSLWVTVREGRRLLLKGLPKTLRNHPEEIARLHKEYSLGMRLQHTSIVAVYGFENREDIGPVIVMEYVDGISLADYLLTPGSKKERSEIALRIAEGLAYAHSCGIAHRDLKPDNILLTRSSLIPKIIDFGNGDSSDFAVFKKSGGTEAYGAPEQLDSFEGDAGSDVYSFGKILELLLPEPQFRKLVKKCLNNEVSLRPKMKDVEIALKSYANRNSRRVRIYLISGFIMLLGILTAVISSQLSKNDREENVIPYEQKETAEESPVEPEITVGKEDMTEQKAIADKQQPVVEKQIPDVKTQTEMSTSSILDKYIKLEIKEIEAIGKLPYTFPLDMNIENRRQKRYSDAQSLVVKLEKELIEQGANEGEVSERVLAFWTAFVTRTNKIDGVNETQKKILEQNK